MWYALLQSSHECQELALVQGSGRPATKNKIVRKEAAGRIKVFRLQRRHESLYDIFCRAHTICCFLKHSKTCVTMLQYLLHRLTVSPDYSGQRSQLHKRICVPTKPLP